ncbi:CocE/NonD family hydrolase [Pseudactinotalea sp. HY158]|nr:CocE/NonD family hydrolase [Pseudactinotalea sp. HY158]
MTTKAPPGTTGGATSQHNPSSPITTRTSSPDAAGNSKWTTFYGEPARRAQLAFFDRHLRGVPGPAGIPGPAEAAEPVEAAEPAEVAEPAGSVEVRLEVREAGDRIVEVREEHEWPLARTDWTPLYLAPGGLLRPEPAEVPGSVTFRPRRRAAAFTFTAPADLELTGPMALRIWLAVEDGDDVDLVAGVEKWRGSRYVGFEGSYGFGRDRVATGWQRASLRELDEDASRIGEPVHTYRTREPLRPGEVVPVDVALGHSATLFRPGESLRLVIGGRWLWPANPLTGNFPARYRCVGAGRCTLRWGPERPAHLLVPRIPTAPSAAPVETARSERNDPKEQ